MGKGILLIVAAGVIAGSMALYQAQRSSHHADETQTQQQSKVLAREIARSAYNSAFARARKLSNEGLDNMEISAEFGSATTPTEGEYQDGGTYQYWADAVGGEAYKIGARGLYADASYRISATNTPDLLTAPDFCDVGCNVNLEFEQSQAGYCSAIYLKRTLDDSQGQLPDSVETDPDPELVFASGHNRNGDAATFEREIQAGTQMNFILAVDINCDVKGDKDVAFDDDVYNHTRKALGENRADFGELPEAGWAITELDKNQEGRWRIDFEDRPDSYGGGIEFTEAKRNDIKENGYPDSYNVGDDDWNGTTYDPDRENNDFDYRRDGFIKLRDYGNIPDFSDQVFYVELTPKAPPSDETPPTE